MLCACVGASAAGFLVGVPAPPSAASVHAPFFEPLLSSSHHSPLTISHQKNLVFPEDLIFPEADEPSSPSLLVASLMLPEDDPDHPLWKKVAFVGVGVLSLTHSLLPDLSGKKPSGSLGQRKEP
jgi:hypothetical protein